MKVLESFFFYKFFKFGQRIRHNILIYFYQVLLIILGPGQLEKKQNKAIDLLSNCFLSYQKLFER